MFYLRLKGQHFLKRGFLKRFNVKADLGGLKNVCCFNAFVVFVGHIFAIFTLLLVYKVRQKIGLFIM